MAKLLQVYGATEFQGKQFAYDGEKCLFTMGLLPLQRQEFTVLLEEETGAAPRMEATPYGDDDSKKKRRITSGAEFLVKIENTTKVNMKAIDAILKGERNDKAQDALRVLDIVLRQHAAARGYILVKENYFSRSFGVADIGEGVETCQGYHVSFRPTVDGLSLNLDVATTTLIKPSSVLEFLCAHFNTSNPENMDWHKAKGILKHVKVKTPHNNIIHRIHGFSDAPCSQMRFTRKTHDNTGNVTETDMTVQQYHELQYNIKLRFPHLPCIAAGRVKRPIYIPVELCDIIPGQRYTKSLSSNQRQKMIDQARQKPEQRKYIVQKAMEVSSYNSDELVRAFNISIDGRMTNVAGRILDPPTLRFQNKQETPTSGRWNFNSKIMVSGAKIKDWVVLNFDSRTNERKAKEIADGVARVCSNKGMEMGPANNYIAEPYNAQRLPPSERVNGMIERLKQQLKAPPDFMLCILPIRKTCDLYGPFKKVVQTKLAITTQCLAPPKTLNDQFLTNLALKINAKAGGYNSWLTLESDAKLPKVSQVPTIIFGMDVSHGSPGYADSPSIAAVVASREWPLISKYGVRVKAQSRKLEMIAGLYEETKLGGMVGELLHDFYATCKPVHGVSDRRPMQIIIFRDGVSESQFEQVLSEELQAFRKAFAHIDKSGTYNPRVTLIVVQKKHHTRFFPATGSGNVAPGTIVDKSICHPRDYDFYLCAHNGMIGTTRPTHYQVLLDENNFSTDDLQQLTHWLCYTYARSTTAVSVVAPVAYAHLAATHARNFLDTDGGSETSSQTGKLEGSTHIDFAELHEKMKSRMFFC